MKWSTLICTVLVIGVTSTVAFKNLTANELDSLGPPLNDLIEDYFDVKNYPPNASCGPNAFFDLIIHEVLQISAEKPSQNSSETKNITTSYNVTISGHKDYHRVSPINMTELNGEIFFGMILNVKNDRATLKCLKGCEGLQDIVLLADELEVPARGIVEADAENCWLKIDLSHGIFRVAVDRVTLGKPELESVVRTRIDGLKDDINNRFQEVVKGKGRPQYGVKRNCTPEFRNFLQTNNLL